MMPVETFHSVHYLRHNDKRLQHLDALNLVKQGMKVLEVGAGIGDHTRFLLSKGCIVTATEARPGNLKILKETFPQVEVTLLDLDAPDPNFKSGFDTIYCYGTLYHLSKPNVGIKFMAERGQLLLLETCVSYGNGVSVNLLQENVSDPSQSFNGFGCRPTRPWVFAELKKYYPFVYVTKKQPNHEEFPLDWTRETTAGLHRAVFVASCSQINSSGLLIELPAKQEAI